MVYCKTKLRETSDAVGAIDWRDTIGTRTHSKHEREAGIKIRITQIKISITMKTTMEFELPLEQSQYQDAINGWKWHLVAFQMEQFLRARIKYAPDSMPEDVYNQLVEVQTKFYQIVSQYNLTIES